jgi:hypothetical protein
MPISKDEVTTILGISIPDWVDQKDKENILNEIGDYLVNEVVSYTESGVSAVDGVGEFPKLNPKYAKSEKAGDERANLDLTGAMLGSVEYKITDGSLEIGVFDKDQAPKAYNHNVGDTLPKRQFIPDKGQKFDPDIMSGIDDLLSNFLDDLDYNPDKGGGLVGGADNGMTVEDILNGKN